MGNLSNVYMLFASQLDSGRRKEQCRQMKQVQSEVLNGGNTIP